MAADPGSRSDAPAGSRDGRVGDTYVRRVGNGAPIVCLHGFTHTGASFAPLADELPDFALIAPDLPGHGESRIPPAQVDLDAATAVVRGVVESIGEPVPLFGYSMGGRLALHVAVTDPAGIESLVLLSASPGVEDAAVRRARRAADAELAAQIERDGIEAFVREWEAQTMFAGVQALPEPTRGLVREMRLSQKPNALAAGLRGLSVGAQPNHWPDLADLEIPMMAVTGADDEKFEAIADEIARRCRHCARVSIADAGHAVHLEAPRRVAETVKRFLGRHRIE